MIGVKEMRMNLGQPGSLPKSHNLEPNSHINALKEALNQRRKIRVAKARLINVNSTKQPGVDDNQNPVDTGFMDDSI